MFRSTFAGFTSAQLALSASQRALDVVGQNIANLNKPGYTRQRLDLASISPVGASYSQMQNNPKVGQGVLMTGISQVRDPFLDIQYRDHLAQVGTVDSMDSILNQIGKIFDETDKTAIGAALDKIVSQLNNMANPDSTNQGASDTLVRSSMEVLLNVIRQNSTELDTVQNDLITKLKDTDIGKINGYLNSIAELNSSIKSSQILGSPALELQDQRNDLIDQLATYLPIRVSYETEKIGSGISVEKMKITFTSDETPGKKYTLVDDGKVGKFAFDTSAGKAPVKLSIEDTNGTTADVTDVLGDGVLKGSIDMLNKSGTFDTPPSDVKGIGYYQKFFDTFVDEFATTLNTLNGSGKELFTKIDDTLPFSASNIQISKDWMNGTISITTSTQPGAGSTANDNVLKMIDAISKNPIAIKNQAGDTVFTGTMFEAYTNIQSTQAIERQSTSSILKNKVSVMNQIANDKDSVSGVYLDEEVMYLMRYQQSYNAAARVMTAMDEALDILINKMGVVGR